MLLGIDIGYSSTKIVVLEKDNIVYKYLFERISKTELEKFVMQLLKRYKKINKIGITGSKSRFMKHDFGKIKTTYIGEISAICRGGMFLAPGKREKNSQGLVVSCGTGTCITFSGKKAKPRHLGGTGVGGGTILGLSKIMLKTEDIRKIEGLSKKGSLSNIDLSVGDIVGSSIGLLPENMTASNFGKIKSRRKEDIAKAILNLAAEVIASASIFAAKSIRQKTVYLCGRTVTIDYVYNRINALGSLFKTRFIKVSYPEYAIAVGAALIAGSR